MPKKIKIKAIERNMDLQIKTSAIIFVLSLLTLLPLLSSPDNKGPETSDFILHYTGMTIIHFVTFVFALSSKKITILRKSNLILIINFACQEFMCYRIFAYGVNPFNSLIIFVCLATLEPIIFAIEPLYYMIVLLVMGFLMGPRFVELYGSNSASNAFIYLLIMAGLSMSRWLYVKNNIVFKHKTKEREQQIQKELDMAALVQKNFYRHDLSDVKTWNVSYYNNPMMNVSGDLFDFFIRKNNLEGLCIFDVSGHGLAAGLVTMLVKNTMEEEFYNNEDIELDFTMQRINDRINEEKGDIENYLTGIILRFTDNNNIEMVNAGHPKPILYKASTNTCNYMDINIEDIQGAIGLSDFYYDFKTHQINLEKNDRIILYTDGITEAKNLLNNEYGKERFLASVQRHSNLDVENQISAVVNDVKQFMGTEPQSDDISIIILEKK